MNWKIGILTKAYQYPESVGAIPRVSPPYQLAAPLLPEFAKSIGQECRPPEQVQLPTITSCANVASSNSLWNFGMSSGSIMCRSRKLLTASWRRLCTISSAPMRIGRAIRNERGFRCRAKTYRDGPVIACPLINATTGVAATRWRRLPQLAANQLQCISG